MPVSTKNALPRVRVFGVSQLFAGVPPRTLCNIVRLTPAVLALSQLVFNRRATRYENFSPRSSQEPHRLYVRRRSARLPFIPSR